MDITLIQSPKNVWFLCMEEKRGDINRNSAMVIIEFAEVCILLGKFNFERVYTQAQTYYEIS